MSREITYDVPTVNDARVLPSQGPWTTKSNGQLTVDFGLGFADLNESFLHYEASELAKIPQDIRGLRSYHVAGLQKGSVGANEWHRARSEIVTIVSGSVKWTCEDVFGNRIDSTLDSALGIWVPPLILHTYETLEDHTRIQVIASTIFFPDDPSTHDTYSAAEFMKLQEQYRSEKRGEGPRPNPASS